MIMKKNSMSNCIGREEDRQRKWDDNVLYRSATYKWLVFSQKMKCASLDIPINFYEWSKTSSGTREQARTSKFPL